MEADGSISWYQAKIGNYDKQSWEKSIEQRILHGLETRPKKKSTLNTNLLDIDLIRGTAFLKASPKNDWSTVVMRGLLHAVLAPFYWNYWRRHTSPRIAAYIIFHFLLQLLQFAFFLFIDPEKTNITDGDVFVPLIMGLGLGILHAHITSHISALQTIMPPPPVSPLFPSISSDSVFDQVVPSTNISGSSWPRLIRHSPVETSPPPLVNDSKNTLSYRPVSADVSNGPSLNVELNVFAPMKSDVIERKKKPASFNRKESDESSTTNSPFRSHKHPAAEERGIEADDDSNAGEEEEDGSEIFVKSSPLSSHRHSCSCTQKQHKENDKEASTMVSWLSRIKRLSVGHDADVDVSDAEDSDQQLEHNWQTKHSLSPNRPLLLLPSSPKVYMRKRSASLSSDFCFSAKQFSSNPNNGSFLLPPDDVLQLFKEAKLRGVPDPEVFAHFNTKNSDIILSEPSSPIEVGECTEELTRRKINNYKSDPVMEDGFLRQKCKQRWSCMLTDCPENQFSGDASDVTYLDSGSIQPVQNNGFSDKNYNAHEDDNYDKQSARDAQNRPINYIEGTVAHSLPNMCTVDSVPIFSTSSQINERETHYVEPGCSSSTIKHFSQEGDSGAEGEQKEPNVVHRRRRASSECSDDDYDEEEDEHAHPGDTLTSRRRQRAKFLQLFWERATRQRVTSRTSHEDKTFQQQPSTISAITTTVIDTDILTNNHVSVTQSLVPETTLSPSKVFEVDSLIGMEPSGAQVVKRNRSYSANQFIKGGQKNANLSGGGGGGSRKINRGSSLAILKRAIGQGSKAKSASQKPLTVTTGTSMDKKALASPQQNVKGQTASETEYDRMNSDIGSDADSSSVSNECSRHRTTTHRRSSHVLHHHNSPNTENGIPLKAPCRFPDPPSPLLHLPVTKNRNRKTPTPNQFSVHILTNGVDDMTAEHFAVSPDANNVPSINGIGSNLKEDAFKKDDEDPFLLWYMRAFQGISNHSSAGSLETVWCYIWEGEILKKVNLTLLDIGWSIIQAVERQAVSFFYPKLSCFVAVILSFLPLIFHGWYNQPSPSTSASSSLVFHGPFPEAVSTNQHKTNGIHFNSFTTFFFAIFQVTSNLITHVITASSPESELGHLTNLTHWVPAVSSDNLVIGLGILLRLNLYGVIFFLLCVAERTFQQRLLYAKHFFSLTSGHRARKCHIPHFRLNKVTHVKCWLTLRSYLKKQGPQRSVESIITSAFYMAFAFGLYLCAQLLMGKPTGKHSSVFSSLAIWDFFACTASLCIFLLRFLTLGTKITKKYRNLSVLITEQINLYLSLEKKPHKKEEISITNQVLRLADCLLKEVDGPYRISGWAVNPLVYNIFKLVLLSCFSAVVSDFLGFKLKLYKLKLNPANW